MATDWSKELGILEETITKTGDQELTQISGPEEASYNRDEVIKLCEHSLDFLAAAAMPETFIYNFPPVLKTIWQILLTNVNKPKEYPQLAIGIPRGHAKTTLVKLFILWCILFSQKKFILVVSSTSSLAENVIADVFDFLDEPNIKSIFGNWRTGLEKDTQTLKKFGFRKRNIIVGALGSEGSMRGLNVKNARPDVMIFEDVQTKENAESAVASATLERWLYGTAMKAKSPEGCLFMFVGNMYPTNHSILKKLKTNPTWTKFISGAILADGTALWQELRSLDSLIEELNNDIAAGHPEIFFSEVLNDTDAGVNSTVDFSAFKQWLWTSEDHPDGQFLVIDPSQGKGKNSDAIGRFEIYDGKIGVADITIGKYSPGNLVRRTIIEALRNDVRVIAVEAMGYQYTLLYWFEEISKNLGIDGIMFVPIYVNQSAKNSRIAQGLKSMQAGEIILHGKIRSLVQKQIADWNPLKKDNIDDILDVISYAPKVLTDHAFDIMTPFSAVTREGDTSGVVEDNHLF